MRLPPHGQIVGRNCVIGLAWSVNRSGLVHPNDAAAYKAFGQWIKAQYGPPPRFNGAHAGAVYNQTIFGNKTAAGGPHSAAEATLVAQLQSKATSIDRAMIMEDQRFGQRIRAYTLEAQLSSGGTWVQVASGHSVGNKRIDIFERGTVVADALRLTVVANQASPVFISFMGGFTPLEPPPAPSASTKTKQN